MGYGEAQMKVKVPVKDLLEKLEANRATHIRIVQEARVGYLEAAQKALSQKMKALKAGKVLSLNFGLSLPADHTRDYDTAIGMLVMTREETIELSMDLYQQYVEDRWGWKRHFLLSNSGYSGTSALLAGEDPNEEEV